ncbi:acyl-coenzyme A synthetase ACSM1, mitochondrial [Otolemur garnettii]|uniref:acyl-coenzyme A synthetase ACSM1, mitochondrial n=1 Tax=Otolemur garnettii TaxID=30611 RepID=UPI0006447886|nr:acyl-coenzyme A synthetase ACSM1, mitochondrial [Otolemur garnettii]
MQWLIRFQVLRTIYKSSYGFHSAPWQLRYQSSSKTGAARWNDHDVPEEFNFASCVLDYWAQMEKEGKIGPNPAFWWVNRQGEELKWTFREITDLTCRVANIFKQTCGLQQGDRLALILPQVPEWWLATVGCIRTGIIFIPGTIQLKAKDILYRLQVSKAKGIMTTETLAPDVDSVASECPALKTKILVSDHRQNGWLDFRSLMRSASPDHTCFKSKTMDPMVIFFTSGTTGLPRMATHCHGFALRSSFPSCRKLLNLKTSDVIWCLSDPGWILSFFGSLIEPWTAGSTVFIHYLPHFDPKVTVQALFKYPITHFLGVPSIFRMILKQNFTSLRFPTLEHCLTSGESQLPEEHKEWKRQTGLLLYDVYGQKETGPICGVSRGMKIKPGSAGKAMPPYDVQIIDDKGNILPPNTEGSVGIRIKPTRPTGIFKCYEGDPEKTAEVECGDFYNTGDKATIDTDGYIWIKGRNDDIINASGYLWISPNLCIQKNEIQEVVKAFIVLSPQFLSHDRDQLTKELQEHVKMATAPYKYPRKVEFVLELPKTITGKIKRSELRRKEFGLM